MKGNLLYTDNLVTRVEIAIMLEEMIKSSIVCGGRLTLSVVQKVRKGSSHPVQSRKSHVVQVIAKVRYRLCDCQGYLSTYLP